MPELPARHSRRAGEISEGCGKRLSDFIQNMLRGFTGFFQTAANTIVSSLLQAIIDMLCPLLVSFLAIMSNTVKNTLTMSTKQFLAAFPAAVKIQNYLVALGVAFAVGLFLLGLFRNLFSGLGFEAQSPISMGARFFTAIFLCLFSSSAFQYLFTGMFGYPYGTLMSMTTDTIKWQRLAPDNLISVFLSIGSDFNPFQSQDKGQSRLLASILVLILMLMIVYNFCILVVEMFERYLMVNVMVVFSPLAASSVVLSSTSNIFKSFCRMFFGQNLLLLCNAITLCMINASVGQFSNAVSQSQNAKAVLVSALLIVAFLKIAQHLDNYLRDLGLTVGISGGNMLSEIIVSAKSLRNIFSAVQNAGRTAVKYGSKAARAAGSFQGGPGILGGNGGTHFTPPAFGGMAGGPKPAGPDGFGGPGGSADGFRRTAADSEPIRAGAWQSGTAEASGLPEGRVSAGAAGEETGRMDRVSGTAGSGSREAPRFSARDHRNASAGTFPQAPVRQLFHTGNTAKMQVISTIGAPALSSRFAQAGMDLSSIKSTGSGALMRDNAGNLHFFTQTDPSSLPSFQNVRPDAFTGGDGNTWYHADVNKMGEPMQAYLQASYDAGRGTLDAGKIQESAGSFQTLNHPAGTAGETLPAPDGGGEKPAPVSSGREAFPTESAGFQTVGTPGAAEPKIGGSGKLSAPFPEENGFPSKPALNGQSGEIRGNQKTGKPAGVRNPVSGRIPPLKK